jgi:hypothetical protein
MTTQTAKKMHYSPRRFLLPVFAGIIFGVVEALLLARLIVRLFAARPDNPSFALLLWLTAPLRAPLAFLDAGQPSFGAVLEYSTLTMALLVPLVGYLAWIVLRAATVFRHPSS